MKLPWSTNEYVALDPTDLKPHPEPTHGQRIRVAAALATVVRDLRMTGQAGGPNTETIRAVLVMNADAWARDIGAIAQIVTAYDAEDPKVRYEQTLKAYSL